MAELFYNEQTGQWQPGINHGSHVEFLFNSQPQRERRTEWVRLFGPLRSKPERGCVTGKSIVAAIKAAGDVDELHLLIDSEGGNVDAMWDVVEALNGSPAKEIVTHCVGKAWSAAGVIWLMGDRRLMVPGATLLVHGAHVDGDATSVRCRLQSRGIAEVIAERTGIDVDTVGHWMRTDTYLDDAHALRLGFATGVDFDSRCRAAYDITRCAQPLTPTDAERAAQRERDFQLFQAQREQRQRKFNGAITAKTRRLPIALPPVPAGFTLMAGAWCRAATQPINELRLPTGSLFVAKHVSEAMQRELQLKLKAGAKR